MRSTLNGGFSLLEVILVTLLITILASTGWPVLQRNMQQQQLLGAAELLYLALRDARLAAIGSGVDWWFGKAHSGELCFANYAVWPAHCSPQLDGDNSVISLAQLPEQIHVEPYFHAYQAARFSAYTGMAGFSSGRFEVRHSELAEATVTIIVSSLGRIRMCTNGAHSNRVPPC